MLKKNYLLALVGIMAGLLFFSCGKENVNNIIPSQQYEKFKLEEGVLIFNDEVSFKNTLDELYLSQDEVDNWEKSIPGYTSLRTQFEMITDENAEEVLNNIEDYKFILKIIEDANGEKSVERNIYNDVLATLINKDGLVQIGDQVYLYTYDHYYVVNRKDIDLLTSEFIDDNDARIEKIAINRKFIFEDTNESETAGTRAYIEGECTKTSGKYRVKGQIIREDIWGRDCHMKTKHQRKRFGVWWSNKTSIFVSFSGNFIKIGTSCVPTPYVTPYFALSGSEGNRSSVTRTVPGNHVNWSGCNGGEISPFHNGRYTSTHVAGGKVCTLACPPGQPCN